MRKTMTAIALIVAATANGGIEHTVLHGASVGSVRVWIGPQAIPGLTRQGLQSVVESSIRQAGITVDPAGTAVLGVSANILVTGSDPSLKQFPPTDAWCLATLEGRLVEDARLERNGLRVEASSWSRQASFIGHVDACAEGVTKQAQYVVADFVETFRAMNPAAPTTR
jgi:hypothetical protein